MTFMKCYGLGAVGFTMLITAIGVQWYLFCESFFHQIYWYNSYQDWTRVEIDIYKMMNSLFGVSAVLITFGALIGKIKPFQLMILTIMELALHAFNYECILVGAMQVADVGGTYADHMFGAYFGLAVAFILRKQSKNVEPATGYVADIFSLIGTLFLWIYWPSFVGGGAQADSEQQQRAIMNTILSLSASTIMTFFLSSIMAKEIKFRPVDIQNATLAGGVAIGCVANFNMNPFNSVIIGAAAGLWSTFGFNVIQPFLFENFGLHDTCGVHNLHAMPSVIGAIASIILSAYQVTGDRGHNADIFTAGKGQPWRQLIAMCLTITCAVIGGVITGFIITCVEPSSPPDFDDDQYWETAWDYRYLTSESAPLFGEDEDNKGDEEAAAKATDKPAGGAPASSNNNFPPPSNSAFPTQQWVELVPASNSAVASNRLQRSNHSTHGRLNQSSHLSHSTHSNRMGTSSHGKRDPSTHAKAKNVLAEDDNADVAPLENTSGDAHV